jgi:hypothetical protein
LAEDILGGGCGMDVVLYHSAKLQFFVLFSYSVEFFSYLCRVTYLL